MLLFLLNFYLHYDLVNCDEIVNAKFNESLITDKFHQNLLLAKALLKEHKNLPADFHPSPQYNPSDRRLGLFHGLPNVFPGFKIPLSPLVIPRPSSPHPMAIFQVKKSGQRPGSTYPGHIFRPMHLMRPKPPPRYIADYRYQNLYLRPPGPYLPSPSDTPGPTRLTRLPFLYAVNHYVQKNPHLINPLRPSISSLISNPTVSSRIPPRVTIPSSTMWTSTIGHNAKIWLQQIAPYTAANENFNNPSKYQSVPHYSATTTAPFSIKMPKTNNNWFSTGAANTGQLFKKDERGFFPVKLAEKDVRPVNEATNTNTNYVSTVAGDVLHGRITTQKLTSPPKERYFSLMEQLDEGYMMVFMIELCRMIAVKDKQEVRDVLHHTEIIYNSLWSNGRLAWIRDPLQTVIRKLSIIMSGRDIDLVRTYTSMMFHMLLQRKQTLSAEVNSIIDEADLFYDHDEGDRLMYSLKQFEDYPNTTKNSYWMCDSLIESFLLPFRRLSGSRRRQRLIESINTALKQRFPLLLREHKEGTLAGHASKSRTRKRKRHHRSHKHKRERKRPEYNNKNIYGRQYSQDMHYIDYRESILGITTVNSDQPKFRVVTSKVHGLKKRRPPIAYLVSRSARNRKLNYQRTTPSQEQPDSFDKKRHKSTKKTVEPYLFSRKTPTSEHTPPSSVETSNDPVLFASSGYNLRRLMKRSQEDIIPYYRIYEKLKESRAKKKDKTLKLKAELSIKMMKSSSYSDEAELMTNNLNEAFK